VQGHDHLVCDVFSADAAIARALVLYHSAANSLSALRSRTVPSTS